MGSQSDWETLTHAGTGWSALMQIAFIPLYIKFMGIEAYGLVGFYITLQGALQISRGLARVLAASKVPEPA